MKTLKGWITTTFLLVTFAVNAAPTNAGIIFGGRSASETSGTCSETQVKLDSPSIFSMPSIIVAEVAGIIFGGSNAIEPTENCGIIFGGDSK